MPPNQQSPYSTDQSTLKHSFLRNGLEAMAIEATDTQLTLLLDYLAMLERWNKAYNLTAIREPLEMINLHLLDSLSIHDHLDSARDIIDVGTGPGLPGIPLAIMNPDKKFTLLDSNGKKTRFLFQAINQLALANAIEVNQRVELYRPNQSFDTIMTRAFSSIPEMLENCCHLASDQSCFMAMKGKNPESELSLIKKDYMVSDMCRLKVPGVEGERHLIKIKNITSSNK
jgi:16S rRNA (guanine527-N7)-methyltransferase